MAIFLQDLDQQFPIVDPKTGKPTDYFMRLLRGQTGDLADGLTDADAAITALQTDVATLEGRNIDTGFGLSGGGDLSADRTLALGNPALTDPGADRGVFWDDSAGRLDWLTFGSGLTVTDQTLTASGGGGGGGGVNAIVVKSTGTYISNRTNTTALTTLSGAANRIDFLPYIPSHTVTIDQITVDVTTGVAGNIKLALYSSNTSSGEPDALIEGSGDLTTTSSTATIFNLSVDRTLTAGTLYWLAIHTNNSATFRACGAGGSILVSEQSNSGSSFGVYRGSYTYGSGLPNPASLASPVATAVTAMAFKMRIA